jgi:hypothetical protein
VSVSCSEAGKYIGIFQLIAQYGEHHQGSIESLLKINRADISLLKGQCAAVQGTREFLPGLGEHTFGAVYSNYPETSLKQGNGMVPRSASQIQDISYGTVSVGLEDPLDEVTFSGIIFIMIEPVIGVGVCRAETRAHASTSCAAPQTRAN